VELRAVTHPPPLTPRRTSRLALPPTE
jgi:hypothetical protein